ncbi:MAG: hypothetical protein NUW22_06845 [Acidobacteria bacterium]|nr:hypothetical protein [Acidobacteriota bacterium]
MYQHRQIHVWITESDYLMLREQSVESRESVSAVVRRLVKNERLRLQDLRPAPDGPAPEILRTYVS